MRLKDIDVWVEAIKKSCIEARIIETSLERKIMKRRILSELINWYSSKWGKIENKCGECGRFTQQNGWCDNCMEEIGFWT